MLARWNNRIIAPEDSSCLTSNKFAGASVQLPVHTQQPTLYPQVHNVTSALIGYQLKQKASHYINEWFQLVMAQSY